MRSEVHPSRIRLLREGKRKKGPIVYWMSRDQRLDDNWAFIFAQGRAINAGVPLHIVFCLVPEFLRAGRRQYGFMLRGLKECAKYAAKMNIDFALLQGGPEKEVPKATEYLEARELVLDFDPLRIKQNWKRMVLTSVRAQVYEVDAHNIVPCWTASDKKEYAARTIRPKIEKLLPSFLHSIPETKKHPYSPVYPLKRPLPDPGSLLSGTSDPGEVSWIKPGGSAAKHMLERFVEGGLEYYHIRNNDPNADAVSNLSPYLHFGQLSAQRVALHIQETSAPVHAKQAFLEQLIIRRELAENFCFYTTDYDSLDAVPQWARDTLQKHSRDPRPYIYTPQTLEAGKTHDPLWNAAQLEMVSSGKMHGYLRMYWAKKILEWTPDPDTALEQAIYLNDRYQLDGRDPNGYAGLLWSIGGLHDQGWKERPVLGKIRYMSYAGCKRKFRVNQYIQFIKQKSRKNGLDTGGLESE